MKRNILIASMIAGVIVSGTYAFTPSASALTISEIQMQIQTLLARIAELTQQANVLQGQTGTTISTGVAAPASQHRICAILNRNLTAGAKGDDVSGLQEFLSEQGYLSAKATGYFGPLTANALARWQASQGISAVGALGPLTRARILTWCDLGGGGSTGNFSASPQQGPAPLRVDFSYQPNEEGGQYHIDFGDGGGERMETRQIYCIRAPCISPQVASHTYVSAGVYTASVSRYIACLYTNPRCMIAQPPPLVQTTIVVTASSGLNMPPTISSFSGPTTLTVGESGTWTITASDPENGQLTYQVWWGDENVYVLGMNAAASSNAFVQTTTFTHSYAYAGTYTVAITVRDSAGKEAKTSSTVQVGGAVACTMQYDPVCGRPPGCMNTCPPGMYCTMMCQPYPSQTYGNRCQLDAAGATLLYAGEGTN